MVNQDMKNNCLIVLISIIISACSAPDSSQGVVSTQDLSTDTTVTTILEDVVEENVVEENLSPEDAQLLLARCLRDNGYDVKDPKNDEGLRSVLTPIFIGSPGENSVIFLLAIIFLIATLFISSIFFIFFL